MDAREALAALRQLYSGYMEDYAEADRPSLLERIFRGGPSKAERKTITNFYEMVESAVAQLLSSLTPEDGALATEAVHFMILDASGPDTASELTVVATQALAIPLLDYVSAEDAKELLDEYQARYPKKRMLTPRQEDLLKALQEHA